MYSVHLLDIRDIIKMSNKSVGKTIKIREKELSKKCKNEQTGCINSGKL